jgi:hypothetical protein
MDGFRGIARKVQETKLKIQLPGIGHSIATWIHSITQLAKDLSFNLQVAQAQKDIGCTRKHPNKVSRWPFIVSLIVGHISIVDKTTRAS